MKTIKKVAEILKAAGNILLSAAALIGAISFLIILIAPNEDENGA